MGGVGRTFATLRLRLEPPPIPVRAEAHYPGPTYHVLFDQPLVVQPLVPGNWRVRHLGRRQDVSAAVVNGAYIDLATTPGPLVVPPDGVSYYAIPPDVVGLTGVPADPFLDLPFFL